MSTSKTTRERRMAKAEQLRIWAESRDAKADSAYAGVQAVTDRIPFGQPILVGHHSERGARADQRRIESGMDRFCEHNAKAREMRSRADNIEAQAAAAIYSDDSDAVERLRAKVAKLEAQRDAMKRRNSEFKKAHAVELKAEPSSFLRNRMLPFPSYAITNIGAEIRRNTKRLEELSAPETGRALVAKYEGECRECGDTIERGESCTYFKRSKTLVCATCAD